MKQEDKELLLRYLCMALPYGVKVQHQREDYLNEIQIVEHISRQYGEIETESVLGFVDDFKPYLRPMSSMTDKEIIEFNNIPSTKLYKIIENDFPWDVAHYKQIDWLTSHHFDFMGLIPKGLAIAVTEENNPYNITEE